MKSHQPDHVVYSEVLSLHLPRIADSRTLEDVSRRATDFLTEINQLLDPGVERVFHEEVEYLWANFPPAAKTIDRCRELVRVLLAQSVEVSWYCGYPVYLSNVEVNSDHTLVNFRRYREDFEVKFTYVQYHEHILMRIPNSLRLRYRVFTNHPGRYTQGLTTTRCKRAVAGLINQISERVALEANSRQPLKVMINSVLRTVTYQESLAKIGYIAPRQSAHLAGYAVDMEKLWYERHDVHVHTAMRRILDDLFAKGVINLIEEESHWHICLNPDLIDRYEALVQKRDRNTS